jgi:hypothetical protein
MPIAPQGSALRRDDAQTALSAVGKGCFVGLRLLQIPHFLQASLAYVPFLELADAFHGSAKHAAGTIALENDVIPLDQNFDRIAFIHLVSFPKRFGKHDPPQLIDLANYACRFQNSPSSSILFSHADICETLNPHALRTQFDKTGTFPSIRSFCLKIYKSGCSASGAPIRR